MTAASESPKVLCIAGSPRRYGNSERLLDALMQGVTLAGGTASKLAVRDAGINMCLGCNACSKNGDCIQRDGMDEVRRQLDSADAIVVATPVYFATVPAVLKTLLDRCQPYWVRRYILHEPRPDSKRPGAVLIVGGGGDPFGTGCALAPIKSVFAVLSVESDRVIEVVGPDKPGDIVSDEGALAAAQALGVSLVESVSERR